MSQKIYFSKKKETPKVPETRVAVYQKPYKVEIHPTYENPGTGDNLDSGYSHNYLMMLRALSIGISYQ